MAVQTNIKATQNLLMERYDAGLPFTWVRVNANLWRMEVGSFRMEVVIFLNGDYKIVNCWDVV